MSLFPPPPPPIVSTPCVGVCQIGQEGLCLGCLRTREEIAGWLRMDEAERRHLIEQVLPLRESPP